MSDYEQSPSSPGMSATSYAVQRLSYTKHVVFKQELRVVVVYQVFLGQCHQNGRFLEPRDPNPRAILSCLS